MKNHSVSIIAVLSAVVLKLSNHGVVAKRNRLGKTNSNNNSSNNNSNNNSTVICNESNQNGQASLSLSSSLSSSSSAANAASVVDPWSFIVLSDFHTMEPFAEGRNDAATRDYYDKYLSYLEEIQDEFGGDLVLIPGDTNRGEWDNQGFQDLINIQDPKKAVQFGAEHCYSKLRQLFLEGGYERILVAIGDHELGDNPWIPNGQKADMLKWYRDGFQQQLNRDLRSNTFLYNTKIGSAMSRPVGTEFSETSFAYQHKNVLFVTMDLFKLKGKDDYFSRPDGLGGDGSVTVNVGGKYLEWLEDVLKEGEKENSIDFIIVQGHIPVLQPVRRIRSSAQLFDRNEDSAFWKLLIKYNVDIYLSGDVHAVTVTQMFSTGPIQIVSRGNKLKNMLRFNVVDENTLEVATYRRKGSSIIDGDGFSPRVSNYEEEGTMKIKKRIPADERKSSTSTSSSNTDGDGCNDDQEEEDDKPRHADYIADWEGSKVASSSGTLVPIRNFREPIIRLEFENIELLKVLKLGHVGQQSTIRGMEVYEGTQNTGSFGEMYDGIVGGVELVKGIVGEYAAKFDGKDSRLGILSLGPGGGGLAVSFGLYVKSFPGQSSNGKRILIHYGHNYGGRYMVQDFFAVVLENGMPVVHISKDSSLEPKNGMTINDGEWHHLAISMQRNSCRLSEVLLYVDGKVVPTKVVGRDTNIFQISSGSLSLGGFGYSFHTFDDDYSSWGEFTGIIDEFTVWPRRVWEIDLEDLKT